MKSIFKKISGSPAATDKVLDYTFKAHYPEVNQNMLWSELQPYIRTATRRFIIPYIGQAMYDDIADLIQAGTALSASQTEFVERLRDAVAYCTIMVALPKKKVVVASMGATESASTDGLTAPSLWGFRTTLWSVAQDADRCVDELLAYMEGRVKAGDLDFDLWKDDDAYLVGNTDFFRTTADFQFFQNINSSRRTYQAMLPIMRQAVKQRIVPVISQDQYDALVVQIRENTVSTENETLLEKIRAALAAWTVYAATNKLPILPDQDGFRVIANSDAVDQKAYAAEVVQGAIVTIRNGAEEEARTNTADLFAFLVANEDDYPLWKASTSNPDNDTNYCPTLIGGEYGAIML